MANYTNVPNQLFEDLSAGKLNPIMFNIMLWLLRRANWKTGVVLQVSAPRIQAEMWPEGDKDERRPSVQTIQRWTRTLGLNHYITTRIVKGSHHPYAVLISNYVAFVDDEEKLLHPTETTDYRYPNALGDLEVIWKQSGSDLEAMRKQSGNNLEVMTIQPYSPETITSLDSPSQPTSPDKTGLAGRLPTTVGFGPSAPLTKTASANLDKLCEFLTDSLGRTILPRIKDPQLKALADSINMYELIQALDWHLSQGPSKLFQRIAGKDIKSPAAMTLKFYEPLMKEWVDAGGKTPDEQERPNGCTCDDPFGPRCYVHDPYSAKQEDTDDIFNSKVFETSVIEGL